MRKDSFIFLIITFVFCIYVSPNSVFAKTYTDTAQINAAIAQCKTNIYLDPVGVLPLLDTILVQSKKTNHIEGIFNAHNLMGISYWMNNNFDQATYHYKEALEYANQLPEPRKKAIVLGNLGLLYSRMYEPDSSQYYYKKAIAYSQKHHITDMEIKAKFDLGNLYLQQDRFIDAIEIIYEVNDSLKIHEDKYLQITTYSTLGTLYGQLDKTDLAINSYKQSIELDDKLESINVKSSNYLNLGEVYFNLLKYDSATYYYNMAKAHALPFNKGKITLLANLNLGNVFLETQELDSCYIYYKKVIEDSLAHTQPECLAAVNVDLGLYYNAINDRTKAKQYLTSGLKMTRDLGLISFERNALKTLYRIDSLEGNFESALIHLLAYNTAQSHLEKEAAKLALEALEFDNYLSTQKLHTHNLEHENVIQAEKIRIKNIIIIAIIAIVILLLILFFSSYKARIKTNKLVLELSQKNKTLENLNSEIQSANLLLNKNEQELVKTNRTKDKFFSILGHDLKSPFNSLLGLLELIDDQWNEMDDEKKHFLITQLYTSSQKTYKLLENLLSWGKAQQGQVICKKEKFILIEKVQSIIDLYQSNIISKDLNITMEIAPDLHLNTDIMLLNQIIQNFVNNAIKFTPKGGQITIKAMAKEVDVKICVTDTGIGLPQDKVERIFDVDTSFNRPGTEGQKSTGMGLILSKEYAYILKGTLSATSNEHKGSSFWIDIPNAVAL